MRIGKRWQQTLDPPKILIRVKEFCYFSPILIDALNKFRIAVNPVFNGCRNEASQNRVFQEESSEGFRTTQPCLNEVVKSLLRGFPLQVPEKAGDFKFRHKGRERGG